MSIRMDDDEIYYDLSWNIDAFPLTDYWYEHLIPTSVIKLCIKDLTIHGKYMDWTGEVTSCSDLH